MLIWPNGMTKYFMTIQYGTFSGNLGCAHISHLVPWKCRAEVWFCLVLSLGVWLFSLGETTDELTHGSTIKGFAFSLALQPLVNSSLSLRTGKNFIAGKDTSTMQIATCITTNWSPLLTSLCPTSWCRHICCFWWSSEMEEIIYTQNKKLETRNYRFPHACSKILEAFTNVILLTFPCDSKKKWRSIIKMRNECEEQPQLNWHFILTFTGGILLLFRKHE